MIGFQGFTIIEPTVSCLHCKMGMVAGKGLIYCEGCFCRDTAEQNVHNLVLRAQLSIMREPMGRAA